jgi:menaquinone-specific isochorismate synthase
MNPQTEPFEEDSASTLIAERRSAQEYHLVSYSQASPGILPADLLRHAQGMERFYWEDGRHSVAFAGFGVAANLMAWGDARFQEIQRKAGALFQDATLFGSDQSLAGPRLFGGLAFRDDFTPDNTWCVFSPAHFVLPHYQLTKVGDGSWLTINALLPPEENPDDSMPQLREALAARYALLKQMAEEPVEPKRKPAPVQVNYPMPYATWQQKIENATQHMGTSALNKAVLSRVCEIRFDQRVDVDGALAYLNRHYANCYRFLFEPRPFHAFYGATPELLAEVNDRSLVTMALASSIRRGATAAEDDALANQLLDDPKERYEHALVVDALKRRLAPFVEELEMPDTPAPYKLSNIQHLFTPIRAQLQQPDGVLPVVEALHPTPALGGSPRDLAMAFIREAEPVPRGWYAAPIGCVDHNLDGIFGVAIRSAVCQEQRVWLYAGAGIVADSIPEKEWEETALKFKPMLNALSLEIGS